jgi:hypothetical protein
MEAGGKTGFSSILDIAQADRYSAQDIIAEDPETYGSMFVPIILGSDKTTVSVDNVNKEYHPLYMSIGNIYNNVRRAHRNGVVLVGFLAIPKGKFCSLHLCLLLTFLFS